MSTAEKPRPMTEEEWKATLAEIRSKLDSIPEDIPPAQITAGDVAVVVLGLLCVAILLAIDYIDGRDMPMMIASLVLGGTLGWAATRLFAKPRGG